MMDHPYGKFGECSFSSFGSIVQADRQTHRQTPMNTLLPRLFVVGVSNEFNDKSSKIHNVEEMTRCCCKAEEKCDSALFCCVSTKNYNVAYTLHFAVFFVIF